jgi:hypothetical protein
MVFISFNQSLIVDSNLKKKKIEHLPKYKSAHYHKPECIEESTQGKYYLSNHNKEGINNSSEANTKYSAK